MSGQSEPMASSIAANYCAKAAFGVLVKPLSWKPGRGLRLNTFRGSWAKDVINYPDTFSPQRESGYVQVTAESYSIHFVAAIFEVASHMGSASSVKEAEKFPEQCFSDNYFRINLARMFRDSEIAGGRRVLGLQANSLPRV